MTPTFFDAPTHYTLAEFSVYLTGLKFETWRPEFPTLHNTGAPSLKQWMGYGATPQERWGVSLNRYYKSMGWHAGPHLVVCPDYVWVLCDLTKPGVSVSCWNSQTFGVEMVGNYEIGGDEFASGAGAKVRDNAVEVLALLADGFDWGDLNDIVIGRRGLHFHHECVDDHHACPGSAVTKPEMLARIAALRAGRGQQLLASSCELTDTPDIVNVEDIQTALNKLGASPLLIVDGDFGPATWAAVKAFQAGRHLLVDGWVGAETRDALKVALTGRIARAD